MPANAEIARLLHELAMLVELEERDRQSFRARAYHNAVRALEVEPRDVRTLSQQQLVAIKGIGPAIAKRIREFAETGAIARLEELRERFPPGYQELVRVPGIGPKTLELLREHLDIRSIDDLKAALAAERLRDVPGLGAKTEENLTKAIERLGMVGKDRRTPIVEALPLAERIVGVLQRVPGVDRVAYAGSLRRFRETVADVDIVAATDEPAPLTEAFLAMPIVREILATGVTKSSVLVEGSVQVDLRVVAPGQWGAAMLYFTGSQAHNIRIRERAVRRGWTLNEYGLFELVEEDGEVRTGELLASASEAEIYSRLDLTWIPPGVREDIGEVDAAADGALPEFASVDDMRGDLHVHTDLSGDGHQTLEEVVEIAISRGYEYLAITDHGEDLRINGASREEMLAQRDRVAELREAQPGLTILHGAELNIGQDGGLDYDEEFLLGYDWTVASVHSHFGLDPDVQTRRVIRAMEHAAVGAIGHLQGRRIGRRPGIELDVDAVLAAAEETGTAIEINCHLDRLDAPVEVLRAARGTGVTFVVSTDTHRHHEFGNMRHGIRQAERGWVPKERIANTWDRERFLAFVAAKRSR
ncbi:MAG: DNA polymerase/3'-5' exonuclease PolX [Nitriliruptorales bacterium]